MAKILLMFVMISLIITNIHSSPLDYYVFHNITCIGHLLQTYPSPTHTVYVLNMTSQNWFDSKMGIKQDNH